MEGTTTSVQSVPSEATLPEEQRGLLRTDVPADLTLRRYERK